MAAIQKKKCDEPSFPAIPIQERPRIESTWVRTRLGSDNSFRSCALWNSTSSSPGMSSTGRSIRLLSATAIRISLLKEKIMIRNCAPVFALLLAAATGLPAQNTMNPTVSAEIKQNYMRTKDLIVRAAAKMPEDGYSFKATPDVRTFAQAIGHISEAQAMLCGGLIGHPTKV